MPGLLIREAGTDDAAAIARLVRALTDEIVAATGEPHFSLELAATTARCRAFLADGGYSALIAEHDGAAVGCLTLCPSRSLYAEGAFGIVQECYVEPGSRSLGAGRRLLDAAVVLGAARGWRRLEVATPPLPPFERTLAFYAANGFTVTGGRKLKRPL